MLYHILYAVGSPTAIYPKFATKLIIFGELTGVHTQLLFQTILLDLVGHGRSPYA